MPRPVAVATPSVRKSSSRVATSVASVDTAIANGKVDDFRPVFRLKDDASGLRTRFYRTSADGVQCLKIYVTVCKHAASRAALIALLRRFAHDGHDVFMDFKGSIGDHPDLKRLLGAGCKEPSSGFVDRTRLS